MPVNFPGDIVDNIFIQTALYQQNFLGCHFNINDHFFVIVAQKLVNQHHGMSIRIMHAFRILGKIRQKNLDGPDRLFYLSDQKLKRI